MYTRSLTITAGLLIGVGAFAQHPQLSVGPDAFLPLGDLNKEYILGVGGSLGFEYPVGTHLGVTVHAGYDILLVQSDFSETIESASFAPVQAGLKYFFQEIQKGVYVHAQLGTHIFTEKFRKNELFDLEEESESKARFSWGIGAGYQIPHFDFALRYNMILPPGGDEAEKEGAEPLSYIGLRIAYLIPLGQ